MSCRLCSQDNGGEFSSDELREVASILDVRDCTTAAYSPFQNGLCERNHAVVDMMLLKMQEQCPNTDLEVLLAWANMAKNSLRMVYGYSPNQLIFGINPVLPNILSAGPPALEGRPFSETLGKLLLSPRTRKESGRLLGRRFVPTTLYMRMATRSGIREKRGTELWDRARLFSRMERSSL